MWLCILVLNSKSLTRYGLTMYYYPRRHPYLFSIQTLSEATLPPLVVVADGLLFIFIETLFALLVWAYFAVVFTRPGYASETVGTWHRITSWQFCQRAFGFILALCLCSNMHVSTMHKRSTSFILCSQTSRFVNLSNSNEARSLTTHTLSGRKITDLNVIMSSAPNARYNHPHGNRCCDRAVVRGRLVIGGA